MELIKNFREKFSNLPRFVVVVIFVVLFLLVAWVLPKLFSSVVMQNSSSSSAIDVPFIPGGGVEMQDMGYSITTGSRENYNKYNTMPPLPNDGYVSGSDAEDFEVTNYSVDYKKENSRLVCESIFALKSRKEVIFESANNYDYGCSYQFKVEKKAEVEIYEILNSLDPRDLSKNTYTIKKSIENLTTESDILKRKQDVVDAMLRDAIVAYDDLVRRATSEDRVDTLAKVIDSKLSMVQKLTNEGISVANRLQQIEKSLTEQNDKLLYTSFNVSVREDRILDKEAIKDSWENAVRALVNNVNRVAQALTVNLVSMLFYILQYAIYILVLVFAGKYVFLLSKKILKGGGN